MCVGVKYTVKHPIMHEITLTTKDILAHSIKMSKAQAEKPCFGDIWHHDLDLNQSIQEGMESLDREAGLN